MLIQGSNNPIVITFDASVADIPQLVATLWRRFAAAGAAPIKVWTQEDMLIDGDTATCPLTEEETAALPSSGVTLEVKGLDEYNNTMFWQSVNVPVLARNDRIIDMVEEV